METVQNFFLNLSLALSSTFLGCKWWPVLDFQIFQNGQKCHFLEGNVGMAGPGNRAFFEEFAVKEPENPKKILHRGKIFGEGNAAV